MREGYWTPPSPIERERGHARPCPAVIAAACEGWEADGVNAFEQWNLLAAGLLAVVAVVVAAVTLLLRAARRRARDRSEP
jgi:hypothetical protein